MSLQFLKADSVDAVALAGISALAFDSDITVGAANAGGYIEGNSMHYLRQRKF